MERDKDRPSLNPSDVGTVTCVLAVRRGEALGPSEIQTYSRPSEGLRAALAWVEQDREAVRVAITTEEALDLQPIADRLAAMADAGPQGAIIISLATVELVRRSIPEGWDLTGVGNLDLPGGVERVFILQPSLAETEDRSESYFHGLFMGRYSELEELRSRLELARIVCVYGAAGIGKSSFVRRYVEEFGGDRESGFAVTYEIDLSGVTRPEVVETLMQRQISPLRMPGESILDSIAASLRETRALVVFDHVEGVLSRVVQIVEALAKKTRNVGFILISQKVPTLRTAARMHLMGLATPAPDVPVTDPTEFDAVRLFLDRAALVDDQFRPGPGELEAIGEIVRRLDGNPLAIEMAATRIRVHRPKALLARLNVRFSLLRDDGERRPWRHRSLAAAIGSNFDLLRSEAKEMLQRLSLLKGAFSLDEACEYAVGEGEDKLRDPEAAFLELADASLLTPSSLMGSVKRFYLSESVRDFALERLRAAGGDLKWGRRHRAFCLQVFSDAEEGLKGADQVAWVERLDACYEDLRHWVLNDIKVTKHVEHALHGFGRVFVPYWLHRMYYSEGLHLAEQIAGYREVQKSTGYPRFLNQACSLALQLQKLREARLYGVRSFRSAKLKKDRWVMAASRSNLALVASREGNQKRLLRHQRFAIRIFRELGDSRALCTCLLNVVAYLPMAEAESAYAEAEAILRQTPNPILSATLSAAFAHACLEAGQFTRALRHCADALEYFVRVDHTNMMAITIRTATHALAALESWEAAAQFYAAAGALGIRPDVVVPLLEQKAWLELGIRIRAAEMRILTPEDATFEPEYLMLELRKYINRSL